jgi:hypothetical protein
MAMYKKEEAKINLLENNRWLLSIFAVVLTVLFVAVQWL